MPAGHHRSVIEGFLAAIRAGQGASAPRYTGHYGEYALHRSRVVDAIYESAASGHEVEIEGEAR